MLIKLDNGNKQPLVGDMIVSANQPGNNSLVQLPLI